MFVVWFLLNDKDKFYVMVWIKYKNIPISINITKLLTTYLIAELEKDLIIINWKLIFKVGFIDLEEV